MTSPSPSTIRLRESDRAALVAHFVSLGREDRRLRFAGPLADEAIAAYVERMDFHDDGLFGVQDDGLRLVAVVHVAVSGEEAELGLSVLPGWRGRGLGNTLLHRAVNWLRTRGVGTVRVHCLAENAAMIHLARKNGMRFLHSGPETDGVLALGSATAESWIAEWLEDQRGDAKRAMRIGALRGHAA